MTKRKTDAERLLESAFIPTSVTGERSGVKTWTYRPRMSVTVSAGRGLRIAVRLFWDSLVALIRRDTVTFEAGESD